MTEQNNTNFTKNLLQKIQKTEPKNRNYFLFRNIGFGLLILFLLAFSIYLLSAFWVDTFELSEFLAEEDKINWSFLSQALFEFVILAGVLITLVYIIYRQTDWLLVGHKIILVSTLLLVVLFGSILMVLTVNSQNQSKEIVRPVENLPYRPARKAKIQEKLDENQIFVGKLVKFDRKNQEIIVKNPDEEKVFRISDVPPDIRLGQSLAIKYEVDQNQNFVAKRVRILPREPIKR